MSYIDLEIKDLFSSMQCRFTITENECQHCLYWDRTPAQANSPVFERRLLASTCPSFRNLRGHRGQVSEVQCEFPYKVPGQPGLYSESPPLNTQGWGTVVQHLTSRCELDLIFCKEIKQSKQTCLRFLWYIIVLSFQLLSVTQKVYVLSGSGGARL